MWQRSHPDAEGAGRWDRRFASTAAAAYRRVRRTAGEIRRNVPGVLVMVPRAATVSVQKLLGRSDYARWSDPQNLEKWWDSRTQTIARLIPAGSRVIEFGAGRCQLQHYLPEGCVYVPSDLAPRQPGTIVCDLNRRPLPDLRHVGASVAVFGGVLEYMSDLTTLAKWLSEQTPMSIASYDHVRSRPGTLRYAAEWLRRRHFGYLNNYTLGGLRSVFEHAGFRRVSMAEWQTQTILVFLKTDVEPAARPAEPLETAATRS